MREQNPDLLGRGGLQNDAAPARLKPEVSPSTNEDVNKFSELKAN